MVDRSGEAALENKPPYYDVFDEHFCKNKKVCADGVIDSGAGAKPAGVTSAGEAEAAAAERRKKRLSASERQAALDEAKVAAFQQLGDTDLRRYYRAIMALQYEIAAHFARTGAARDKVEAARTFLTTSLSKQETWKTCRIPPGRARAVAAEERPGPGERVPGCPTFWRAPFFFRGPFFSHFIFFASID